MNENRKWYAEHTRPGHEKKLSETLTRRRIENYCPLNKIRLFSDPVKFATEPLFPSYVFLRITDFQIAELEHINGVINLLYWLGAPAVIPQAEIAAIKDFLNNYNSVKVEKIGVNGRRVSKSSAQSTAEDAGAAPVEEKVVQLDLPTLGYVLIAEGEASNLKVILRSIEPELKSQAG